MKHKACISLLLAALLAGSLTACSTEAALTQTETAAASNTAQTAIDSAFRDGEPAQAETEETAVSDRFSDRDLDQEPDLSEAVAYPVEDGRDITITAAGVYVLSGSAEDVTVVVDAGDDDKVQLVLNGLDLTNADEPCIYVRNADKVFVTTTATENSLTVTGTFLADGETNTDAVIFSRDDLTLNGTGTLSVSSTDNGVTSKDELKVTGGTLVIDCASDGLEANDAIAVAGGDITITTEKDGLRAGTDDDDTVGEICLVGGTFTIDAGSDAIQGTTSVRIDGGTFNLRGAEGIEGTYVCITGGTLSIRASDDGINAARKSSALDAAVEITGGEITIVMGGGDTDGIDSNGALTIAGGTVDITAGSPFDYDGTGTLSGGTVIINGQETDRLAGQRMGGSMQDGIRQGRGGQFGGGDTDGSTGATPNDGEGWQRGQKPQAPGGMGRQGGPGHGGPSGSGLGVS